MKIIKLFLINFLFCMLVLACKSAPEPKNNADMLANIDSFEMGTAVANVNRFLATDLEQKNLILMLDPRTNQVVVQFMFQLNNTSISLDVQDRQAIQDAIVRYGEAFDAKTLEKKGNHSADFGTVSAGLVWGIKLGSKGSAHPALSLGYKFIDKSPFFVITIPETDNELKDTLGGSRIQNSAYMVLCFNRAQSVTFAEFLSEEKIQQALGDKKVPANLLPGAEHDLNAPDSY